MVFKEIIKKMNRSLIIVKISTTFTHTFPVLMDHHHRQCIKLAIS
jgi:hypothetical protein